MAEQRSLQEATLAARDERLSLSAGGEEDWLFG
jgi:hypothetical protein